MLTALYEAWGPSTDFYGNHRDLLAIQRRGRWKATASVRRYEKAGRLIKQLTLLDRNLLARAKRNQVRLLELLSP